MWSHYPEILNSIEVVVFTLYLYLYLYLCKLVAYRENPE